MADPIRIYAPPKVNLTLEILGCRTDGYHELQSLVAFASDGGDWLELSPYQPDGLTISGPYAGNISGPNIIDQARAALTAAEPRLKLGHIQLEKNIPVAAGIGGGSTDAAALLKAVFAANPDLREHIAWHGIASALGADVPVCYGATAALMTGIGERVQELRQFPANLTCVLVSPAVTTPHNKTAAVFQRLNAPALAAGFTPPDRNPPDFESRDTLIDYMNRHENDLLAPVLELFPVVQVALDLIAGTPGCRLARLSGAGPTCFGIYDSATAAAEAGRILSAEHPDWWIRQTTLR